MIANEDIVIIGGGPGGLAAAKALVQEGISPLLIERSSEFGQKPCGDMVAENLYGFSIYDFINKKEIIENEFDVLRVNFYEENYNIEARSLLKGLRNNPGKWLIVKRKNLEKNLAEQAEKAGARIKMGLEVKKIAREGEEIMINGEIRTKLVIGADGFHSKVRELTGQKIKNSFFAMTCQTKANLDYPCLYFGKKIISRGYGWIFPKGGIGNAGIGSLDFRLVRPAFEKFCQDFRLEPQNIRAGFIPASLPYKSCFDNILLVGDAAGLADALTGGGVDTAMVSGYLAGKVAAKALKLNRWDEKFLRQYEKQWKMLMFSKLYKSFISQKLFYGYFLNHQKITSVMLKWIF